MTEEREMFEAIEMHVERMMGQVSTWERNRNSRLTEYESRMERFLERLREILSERESDDLEAEDE